MPNSERLTCVIPGSFKFKPEIDEAYDELQDNGITVLAPEKGWLVLPQRQLIRLEDAGSLRPLPTEQYMSSREIEEAFLRHLKRADFVYLMNVESYVGNSAAMEIGAALGGRKPIYAREPINAERMELQGWERPGQLALLQDYVRVVPIPGIVEDFYTQAAAEPSERL